MSDWKADQETLRNEIRNLKDGGFKATMLYVLLSHMRGRIHMKSYMKYHGGWRSWGKDTPKKEPAPADYVKAYGECAQKYYEGAAIESLEDQAAWIRAHNMGELFDLANRVLSEYNKKEKMLA